MRTVARLTRILHTLVMRPENSEGGIQAWS